MNAGAKRIGTPATARTVEAPFDGPLKFDFEPTRPAPVSRPEKAASIKEALLRWLDGQL
jgi:hypothetical protein